MLLLVVVLLLLVLLLDYAGPPHVHAQSFIRALLIVVLVLVLLRFAGVL